MARLNNVFLYGFIENKPRITIDDKTGEPSSGIVYLHVVRGYRDDHSGKQFMKHDYPLIVSREPKIIREMMRWEAFDIISVKGVITTLFIDKPSYCPDCKDEHGNAVENTSRGILMYVTPVYAQKEDESVDMKEALSKVIKAREISNVVICYGCLIKNPTYFKTTAGTVVTQYQIALDRKYRIRMDTQDVRTDWPWVKSYGEQAIEDKLRLRKGSEIFIDGVIQARTIHRKTKCKCCGKIYPWEDHTLELVPFDVEYFNNYMTDALLQEEKGKQAEDIRQELFGFLEKDVLTEEEMSEQIDINTVKNAE